MTINCPLGEMLAINLRQGRAGAVAAPAGMPSCPPPVPQYLARPEVDARLYDAEVRR